jgi:hypothetical protein
MARQKTPEQIAKVRSAAAQKGAKTRLDNRKIADASTVQQKHVANNPERYQGFEGLGGGADKMSARSVYRAMGWKDNSPQLHGQQELSSHDGSAVFQGHSSIAPHNDMMPVNRRWEDYSPKEQARVVKAASRYGVTPETAHRSLSAQVDQAYHNEGGHHDSFYSPEHEHTDDGALTPRFRLKESAKQNKVSFGLQAAANAITSPNNTFVGRRRTGETWYPNDEAASHAIKWAQEGKSGDEYKYHPDYHVPNSDKVPGKNGKLVKAEGETRKYPVQGYPENHGKAVEVAKKVINGSPLRDAWKPTDAEKVTAYHNSWVDPHGSSQFWVSDTHSGGAAFAPHLSKPEQQKYMGIQGIHAMHDHIARKVMVDRGLNHLTNMQSAQWSQEKRTRADGHDSLLNNYQSRNRTSGARPSVSKDQGTLF